MQACPRHGRGSSHTQGRPGSTDPVRGFTEAYLTWCSPKLKGQGMGARRRREISARSEKRFAWSKGVVTYFLGMDSNLLTYYLTFGSHSVYFRTRLWFSLKF